MSSGWRVWFAFESRPSITMSSSKDLSEHWRGLADVCKNLDGEIDGEEFCRWVSVIVERTHLWGYA